MVYSIWMTVRKAVLFATFMIWGPLCIAQESPSCTEQYVIDKDHTNIVWYASRMGFSRTIGKFENFEGVINLNSCDPADSNIYITIDTNSIASGVIALDDQLKSRTFFDVESYPQAIFESTEIAVQEKNTANIKGNFTMLGNTREVVLSVRLNKRAMDPIINRMRTGYSIKTSVQRSQWGMDQLLAFVADDINIVIEAEALRVVD